MDPNPNPHAPKTLTLILILYREEKERNKRAEIIERLSLKDSKEIIRDIIEAVQDLQDVSEKEKSETIREILYKAIIKIRS